MFGLVWVCSVLAITTNNFYETTLSRSYLKTGDDINFESTVLNPPFIFFGTAYSEIYVSSIKAWSFIHYSNSYSYS